LWITIHLSSNETNAAELCGWPQEETSPQEPLQSGEELLPLQKTPTTAICLRLSIFI
jgi:hypothetical protein